MDETLVWFGAEVKALDDNGKIGGYLVRFGTAEQTDASSFRDFFTKDTDFGLDAVDRSRILYSHGLDKTIGKRSLGIGTLKVDDAGVWLDGQLTLRDEYEQRIFGMVKAKKLGYSSGTAPHLVTREKQDNGSHKITSWPLGLDASLTPTPAEPRTAAVALKSLALEWAKGELLGPDAERFAAMNAVSSLHDLLRFATSDALRDDKATTKAKLGKVRAAHDEARDAVLKLLGALLPADAEPAAKGLDLLELEIRNRLALVDAALA